MTERYSVILFLLNGPHAEDSTVKFLAVDKFHSRYGRHIILYEIFACKIE